MCRLFKILVMVYAATQTQMLIVVVLLGIGKGIRSVYMSIVIPSYIPLDRLASASALQLFLNGIVILCFGPIAGKLKPEPSPIQFINLIVGLFCRIDQRLLWQLCWMRGILEYLFNRYDLDVFN